MNSVPVVLAVLLLFLLAGVAGYLVSLFNSLIQVKNNIGKAWHNIDVLLLQRNEEIPKLVEITTSYGRYEKELLEELVRLRQRYRQAQLTERKTAIENELAGKLQLLMGTGERYPDIQADQLFRRVQERISDLEAPIADRRTFFNATVTIYNTQRESFPQLIFARLLGFRCHPLLKADGGGQE